ncbi:MAG: hypothetical protein KGL39_05785 [Patescibacteria group bacterium]|nr:hypothetical protein [Patescibacteria group bacterium]
MTRYYAFTSQNVQMSGYTFVTDGTDKAQTREAAEKQIAGDQLNAAKDIYVDTELKNLIVVPESTMQKRANLRHAFEMSLEQAEY